jgi:hypothetical protein
MSFFSLFLGFKAIETLRGVCHGQKKLSILVADFGDFVFASMQLPTKYYQH